MSESILVDDGTILFDLSWCDGIDGFLLTVTPKLYFHEYLCCSDHVDEEVFSILDNTGFAELSESTFEYNGELKDKEQIEEMLLSCNTVSFEQDEDFSDFLNGDEECGYCE